MSAIGEYIHLNYANYLRYGTNHQGQGKDSGYSYDESKQRIKKFYSKSRVKEFNEIEDFINALKNSQEQEYQDIRDVITEKLNESFEGYIRSIDFNTGTVQTTVDPSKAIGKISKNDIKDRELKTVIKKIDLLEGIFASKIAEGNLSPQEYADIVATSQKINTLREECLSYTRLVTGAIAKRKTLRDELNRAIGLYAQYPPKALIEGTLWEYMLAVAKNKAYYKGFQTFQEGAKEALATNVQGGTVSRMSFNMENFTKIGNVRQIIGDRLHLSMSDDGNDYLMARRSKTDTTLTWTKQQYNISAKSINITNNTHSWVRVVSDSPLLTMLSGLDANFVNHYLNVATSHPDMSKSAMKTEGKNIKQDMKKALFYQALTGDNFYKNNTDIANVFAVNNKATGKIKLIDTGELLDSLSHNIGALSVQLGGTGIAEFLIPQKREKTYEARIENLIVKLHEIKLSASFNIADVTSLKSSLV